MSDRNWSVRRFTPLACALIGAAGLPAAADQPEYLWGRDWGGWNYDYAYDIALASDDGGVVVVGSFVGPADMDPTDGVDTRQSVNQTYDLCISKINTDGSYGWAYTTGGELSDNCDAVAIDARDGSIVATGYFFGTVDFDAGPDEHLLTAHDADAFIMKVTRNGEFVWAYNIGSGSFDEATDVVIDGAGNITYTGYFGGTVDFDPGPGFDNRSAVSSDWDSYVSQVGPDGQYHWTHTFGGQNFGWPDFGLGLGVFPNGDLLATGEFHGTADFDPGPDKDERTSSGFADMYLTRYTAQGEQLWTYVAGGPGSDRGWAAAPGPDGGVVFTGRYESTVDFDPGPDQDKRTSKGETDMFVTCLGAGGEYRWTRTAGGPAGYEEGRSLVTRDDGSVVTTGWFRSTTVDFDPGDGVDNRSSVGELDMLLWQLGPGGEYLDSTTWGSTIHDRGYTVLLDGPRAAYICGHFSESMDFDCGAGVDTHFSDGAYDSHLMKLSLPGGCYADYNGDGTLDLFDFLGFVNAFNGADAGADCDGNGELDLFDFLCFVNAFNGGC